MQANIDKERARKIYNYYSQIETTEKIIADLEEFIRKYNEGEPPAVMDENYSPYGSIIFQVNGGPYHLIKWLDELGGFGTCNLCSMRQLANWPDNCLFGIPSQGWWRDFNREIIVVGNIHDNPDFLEKFKED